MTGDDELFSANVTPGHDGRGPRVTFAMPDPDDHRRGPGPKPRATEGYSSMWWQQEVEAVVVELARRPEGCDMDDVRDDPREWRPRTWCTSRSLTGVAS